MHAQQGPRVFRDGFLIVLNASAVGGADFAQRRTTLRHHFGDAKAVADFYQFAARDNHFAVFRKRRKNHQDCCSAVVHHDGVFGARQTHQEFGRVHIALAARSRFEVILQIRVTNGGLAKLVEYRGRKRRTAQVRVQDHSGGIDHRLQRARQDAFHFACDHVFQIGRHNGNHRHAFFTGNFRAHARQHFPGYFDEQLARNAAHEFRHARLAQQFVHRRNLAQQF